MLSVVLLFALESCVYDADAALARFAVRRFFDDAGDVYTTGESSDEEEEEEEEEEVVELILIFVYTGHLCDLYSVVFSFY